MLNSVSNLFEVSTKSIAPTFLLIRMSLLCRFSNKTCERALDFRRRRLRLPAGALR